MPDQPRVRPLNHEQLVRAVMAPREQRRAAPGYVMQFDPVKEEGDDFDEANQGAVVDNSFEFLRENPADLNEELVKGPQFDKYVDAVATILGTAYPHKKLPAIDWDALTGDLVRQYAGLQTEPGSDAYDEEAYYAAAQRMRDAVYRVENHLSRYSLVPVLSRQTVEDMLVGLSGPIQDREGVSARIDYQKLELRSEPITLRYDRYHVPIGTVQIRLSWGRVAKINDEYPVTNWFRVYCLHPLFNEGGDHTHPHIYTEGRFCVGEMQAAIQNAGKRGDLFSVFSMLLETYRQYHETPEYLNILKSQRVYGYYRCRRCKNAFPRYKSKDTVLFLPGGVYCTTCSPISIVSGERIPPGKAVRERLLQGYISTEESRYCPDCGHYVIPQNFSDETGTCVICAKRRTAVQRMRETRKKFEHGKATFSIAPRTPARNQEAKPND